jgi:hypothetical protein
MVKSPWRYTSEVYLLGDFTFLETGVNTFKACILSLNSGGWGLNIGDWGPPNSVLIAPSGAATKMKLVDGSVSVYLGSPIWRARTLFRVNVDDFVPHSQLEKSGSTRLLQNRTPPCLVG